MALAILAQGGLYLGLRHVAVATWPSWAHRRPAAHRSSWPAVVPTDIVAGSRASERPPALVPPVLAPPPPLVALPVPDLNRSGPVTTPSG